MRKTIAALTLALAGVGVAFPAAAAARPNEDEPGWSCVDRGNHVCGPGNSEGKPAACYDDGGVIVALWPCHIVRNPDGSADVYDGLAAGPNAYDAGAYVGGYN